MSGQWYLIYRYRWAGKDLKREPLPVDGVYASHPDAAIQVAATRNDYRSDERFAAVWCSTVEQVIRACELDDAKQACNWWTAQEFAEFMRLPTYQETRTR